MNLRTEIVRVFFELYVSPRSKSKLYPSEFVIRRKENLEASGETRSRTCLRGSKLIKTYAQVLAGINVNQRGRRHFVIERNSLRARYPPRR